MNAIRFDSRRQLIALERSTGRLEEHLAVSEERLRERRPERTRWSLLEHGFHVVLANDLSLRNVRSLLARKGRLIRPCTPLVPEAEAVLRRGRIPRGRSRAPRFVTPPATIDLALVHEIIASTRQTLEGLAPRSAELDAAPDCIPHQELGGLSASGWLRFARLHSAHHLVIMRELAADLA